MRFFCGFFCGVFLLAKHCHLSGSSSISSPSLDLLRTDLKGLSTSSVQGDVCCCKMCFCSQLPGKDVKSHQLPFSLNYSLFGTATGSFWPIAWCLAQQKQDLSCYFSASQQEPFSIFCVGAATGRCSPLQSWSSRLCHWLILTCTCLRCSLSEKMGAPTACMDA